MAHISTESSYLNGSLPKGIREPVVLQAPMYLRSHMCACLCKCTVLSSFITIQYRYLPGLPLTVLLPGGRNKFFVPPSFPLLLSTTHVNATCRCTGTGIYLIFLPVGERASTPSHLSTTHTESATSPCPHLPSTLSGLRCPLRP